MKITHLGGVLALPLLIAACGETQEAATENRQDPVATGAPQAGTIHAASGEVTALEEDRVTISHGPVETLGWPAMTMTFRAGSPEMVGQVSVGDQVSFSFRQHEGGYTLTSLSKGG